MCPANLWFLPWLRDFTNQLVLSRLSELCTHQGKSQRVIQSESEKAFHLSQKIKEKLHKFPTQLVAQKEKREEEAAKRKSRRSNLHLSHRLEKKEKEKKNSNWTCCLAAYFFLALSIGTTFNFADSSESASLSSSANWNYCVKSALPTFFLLLLGRTLFSEQKNPEKYEKGRQQINRQSFGTCVFCVAAVALIVLSSCLRYQTRKAADDSPFPANHQAIYPEIYPKIHL